MQQQGSPLSAAQSGDVCFGFQLVKKEYIASKSADLYTLRHEKTGAELLYFDRADENKTFSVGFKTLPENDTGVFHILEHTVLNGSRKFPVKEPFVSMLQSSMQTFLNAMTFNDKTLFPVSSRNDQDFFNLMAVYLDAVFCPLIYDKPEIFMQEGWHYEFDSEDGEPFYNGVVFSEMKGVFAEVDSVIEEETRRLLFPDTCYGYISGGHPDSIPDLTYQQFVDTHRRFYHPSNAKFFLDGHMDIDAVLAYIDGEYLSKYEYRAPDFDFVMQTPIPAEKTVYYEARECEEQLAHMAIAKILGTHEETEKIYATKILADYLTGSNEAPLKRAFLEQGLAQDVSLETSELVYQPSLALIVRNTEASRFDEIKAFLPKAVGALLAQGLDNEALLASLERFAFNCKEISEPYGVELAMKAFDGWLYGDDPMTHIDNGSVFASLREKIGTSYFADLLAELLADSADKSYLYVLPSLTKGQDDARKEAEKLAAATAAWDDARRQQAFDDFMKMQQWQQSMDSDEVLSTLPHLDLQDVPVEVAPTKTVLTTIADTKVLEVVTPTNGIVYLNLYFDVSDFSTDELRMAEVLTTCFGELRTQNYSADKLQNKIKATMGSLVAKLELTAAAGDLQHCKPYLLVSASMLEENVPAALALIEEILTNGCYDEVERIYETVLQNDYFLKQALIANGHSFAVTKALSAFSAEGALKETLEGESFARWFSPFVESFMDNAAAHSEQLCALTAKAFAKNRLFVGYSGSLPAEAIGQLLASLPQNEMGVVATYPTYDKGACGVEIPADVGFSALGHNVNALGGTFSGACSVMASLMTFGYLWNMVRVQGGAYGTGMNVRANGDIYCYSYRDPHLTNAKAAFGSMADFLADFAGQDIPLDDIIIGTVNTTDPLLDPAGVCDLQCVRYLKGTTPQDIARIRREILGTTAEDLRRQVELLRTFAQNGKFCAIGNKDAVAAAVQA